jgi:hypothetical protein
MAQNEKQSLVFETLAAVEEVELEIVLPDFSTLYAYAYQGNDVAQVNTAVAAVVGSNKILASIVGGSTIATGRTLRFEYIGDWANTEIPAPCHATYSAGNVEFTRDQYGFAHNDEVQLRAIPSMAETTIVTFHLPDNTGAFTAVPVAFNALEAAIAAAFALATNLVTPVLTGGATLNTATSITLRWSEDEQNIAIPALAYMVYDDTSPTQYTLSRLQAGGAGGGGGGGGGTAQARTIGLGLGLGLGY